MSLVGLALFNLLRVFEWIVIIDVVLSWLPIELPKDVQRVLRTITEPVYGLIRRNLPTTWSGVDLTPLLALVLAWVGRIVILAIL